MKELNLDEIKKIQIIILDEVVKFCNQEKLSYFLGYGTLLGAIRHNGYIPWDDDIDLIMPRPDYEIFIHTFNDKSLEFKVYSHFTEQDYYLPFAKVSYEKTRLIEQTDISFDNIGVNIDIFPLDGCGNDKKEVTMLMKKIRIFRNILTIKSVSIDSKRALHKNLILLLGKIALKPINYRKIVNKISKYSMKFKFITSEWVGCLVWNYGVKEIMKKEIFMNQTYIEFEGKNYLSPLDFNTYLSCLYSDYLTLPPIAKRVTHHKYKAVWK